ncbi:MAG: PhoH family protein [Nitrosopumilaceae archaeon]
MSRKARRYDITNNEEDMVTRKTWSLHDLKNIKPLTSTQEEMVHTFLNGQNVCAYGSAGTGKTFLSVYLALNEILNPNTKQHYIILVRSVVPTREVGYLPGTLEEKIALYEAPYHDIFAEIVGRGSTYKDMKDAKKVKFVTTSFIRGLTWNNAVIIIDEAQNMTMHELNSILTRVGINTRIIVAGDIQQSDIMHKTNGSGCGMAQFLKIIDNMREFEKIQFTTHDIVRSAFVKSWIIACEQTVNL